MVKSINSKNGYFLVVEGPSGVGKTTTVELLKERLKERLNGVKILVGKEQSSEDELHGLALLQKIVGDRRKYLEEVVAVALTAEAVFIMDRYIPSSIVYQVLDGLSVDEIWELNRGFLVPDMTVLLLPPSEIVLNERINHRSLSTNLTRFEKVDDRSREIQLYVEAKKFLLGQNWPVMEVGSGTTETTEEIVEIILEKLFT